MPAREMRHAEEGSGDSLGRPCRARQRHGAGFPVAAGPGIIGASPARAEGGSPYGMAGDFDGIDL